MEKRYRIIISGKQLYKEIEISPEHKSLRFGTGLNCDVRVRRGLFFEPVELLFARDEKGEWSVLCSDNLYIYVDEVRKLMSIPIFGMNFYDIVKILLTIIVMLRFSA